jgi:murein DD-endopeptidase MepM/ murein hydrolase activator NlpD
MKNQSDIKVSLLLLCVSFSVFLLTDNVSFATGLDQTADNLSLLIFGEKIRVSQVYLSYDTVNPTKDHIHAGIDFAAPEGKPVKAVVSGKVLTGANTANNIYGTVSIFDGRNSVIYLHMKNISVNAGQTVNVGDKIGEVSSVNAPSVHLHIEVRQGQKPVAVYKTSSGKTPDITIDPIAYITGASTGASSQPGGANKAGSQPALNQTSPDAEWSF